MKLLFNFSILHKKLSFVAMIQYLFVVILFFRSKLVRSLWYVLFFHSCKFSGVWILLIAKNMGLNLCASLITHLLSYIRRTMSGMVSPVLCQLKNDLCHVLRRSNNADSLRLLSMNDKRFIRYYKGHVDRYATLSYNKL